MTAKRSNRKRSWARQIGKWLGIAGLLGVAAGGVLIVRDERQRQAYSPDEVRARLRERAARATQANDAHGERISR